MKKKVRVHAYLTQNELGWWVVKCTDGTHSAPYPFKDDAQKHADYINNEDADDPRYMWVDEYDAEEEREKENAIRTYYARMEAEKKAREERKRKQTEREQNNRKSRKADEKYVYVVSCYERGMSGVVYLQGETNLTKITNHYGGGFITTKVKEAKIFNTKASAQKYIDTLSKCWVVNHLLKNLNVVRKDKKNFE